MGDGLELAAGNRMKNLLEVITKNRLLAVFVGFTVTALIQSSSATTVMVVGFVNAGLMTLTQAVGIIMGANIGTTITSVLIAIDFSSVAPVCIFIGAVMMIFFKKKTVKNTGTIIAGFGLLFLGMNTMSSAMAPLKDSPEFQGFITRINNPFMGILIGVVMTAIMQSSSATIGILQALALQGVVPFGFSIFVLFGQNIGTVVTTFISTAGAKTNAKRAAMIHLLFNVIGTVIFIIITFTTPYMSWIEAISDNASVQISAAHIIFNVVSTIILFPFSKLLVKASCKLVPEKQKTDLSQSLHFLDDRILNAPPFAVAEVGKRTVQMLAIARQNFEKAARALIDMDASPAEEIRTNEETVNFLNHHITEYLIKINALEISESDLAYIGVLFHVVNDIERVGDHAMNLIEAAEKACENRLTLTNDAIEEMSTLLAEVGTQLKSAQDILSAGRVSNEAYFELHERECRIDSLTELYTQNHITRLNEKKYSPETGMLYVNTIVDFERVADHAFNIGGYKLWR